jgi:hypothetical protein
LSRSGRISGLEKAYCAGFVGSFFKTESVRGSVFLVDGDFPAYVFVSRVQGGLGCLTAPDEAQKVLLNRLGLSLPQRPRHMDEITQTQRGLFAKIGIGAIKKPYATS